MVALGALDRLGVGELLIVYHSLTGAEHYIGKAGLESLGAKLTAAYDRLAPSLDVTAAEDAVVRRSLIELAATGDFDSAWRRLNLVLETCRSAEAADTCVTKQQERAAAAAPLVAYNRVRRTKTTFATWQRYARRAWRHAERSAEQRAEAARHAASGHQNLIPTGIPARDVLYPAPVPHVAPMPPRSAAAAGPAVTFAELVADPLCSSPIACSCMLGTHPLTFLVAASGMLRECLCCSLQRHGITYAPARAP